MMIVDRTWQTAICKIFRKLQIATFREKRSLSRDRTRERTIIIFRLLLDSSENIPSIFIFFPFFIL